jgi:pSer/pThr/pTyr-binding forkhead associated (FHA) protein
LGDAVLARLTVHLPLTPARTALVVGEQDCVVGRDPECSIVLDDDRVSRRHARLTFTDGSWHLTDLDSKNGTSLDGRPIADAVIEGGAWIGFGGLLARFEPTTEEAELADAARREERWRTSLSLQRQLSPMLGLPQLLERILDSVLGLSEATRGAVMLVRPGGKLEIAASRGLTKGEVESDGFGASGGAIRRALESRRPVTVSDARNDPFLQNRDSVLQGRIRALVCLPLRAGERLLGVVYADSVAPGAVFTELDVEILEGLAGQAGLAIAVALLDREIESVAGKIRPEPES